MRRTDLYNIAVDCVDRHALNPKRFGRPALIVTEGEGASIWTYKELAHASDGAAGALKKRGLRRGDRILLSLPNGPEFPTLFFGALKAGVIPIPASPLLTDSELNFLLQDSRAKAVFRDPKEIHSFWESGGSPKPVVTKAGDPAFWLYTSGTAGKPKAVIHAHRSIPAHDARSRVWMDLKSNDVVFNTSALNWSYALTCGLADTLRTGAASVIFRGPADPERIVRIIERHRVTIFMSVPGLYRRLTEYCESHPDVLRRMRSLRVCLSAGEKLPAEIRTRFRKATGKTIREGLGMTEHSVYLAQPKGRRVVEGSCGRALPGHRIAVLRPDLMPARPGEIGILASHRSCPGLLLGYYRRPEEEKKSFRKGWFLSGDLAYRDAQGNFFYVGRNDDVITAGGYRISPMEVEVVLNSHPAVSESAVIGVEVASGKTIVCAHVVLKKINNASKGLKMEILEKTKALLASYKVPREILFVSQLPKTPNGKLQRAALRS